MDEDHGWLRAVGDVSERGGYGVMAGVSEGRGGPDSSLFAVYVMPLLAAFGMGWDARALAETHRALDADPRRS